jgi:SAM-dependent methyltransferase
MDSRDEYWRRYWDFIRRRVPDARAAKDRLFDRLLEIAPKGLWLDAGCGRNTFPGWRGDDAAKLIRSGGTLAGCDLDIDALRDRTDGARVVQAGLQHIPFRDETFSCVMSNMVFEHLAEPEASVCELVRVTQRQGRILIHTVNSRHYLALMARATPTAFHEWAVARVEGRGEEDVYPTSFKANTPSRLRGLFEGAGCRYCCGGLIPDLPLHIPFPGLFQLSLGWAVLERKSLRIPTLKKWLLPNLLMEFERL